MLNDRWGSIFRKGHIYIFFFRINLDRKYVFNQEENNGSLIVNHVTEAVNTADHICVCVVYFFCRKLIRNKYVAF